jgi:hypothetical protein
MQTNLKFNNITFIKPIYRSRSTTNKNCAIRYSIKGNTRKNNITEVDLYQLFKSEKLSWKYVRIGIDNNNLIIMEGTKENGFSISTNIMISNRQLVANLFDFFNYRIPTKFNDSVKINLEFKKIDIGIYQLNKI